MVKRGSRILLILGDSCWVGISLFFALAVDAWHRSPQGSWLGLMNFAGVIPIWLLSLYICGAYERQYLALKGRNLSLTLCGAAVATAVTAGGLFLLPQWHMSRLAFVVLGVCAGTGLVLIRALWLARGKHIRKPVFLGLGDPQLLGGIWLQCAGTVGAPGPLPLLSTNGHRSGKYPGVHLCSVEAAAESIRSHRDWLILLTDGTIPSAEAAALLNLASLSGSMVADIFSFYEIHTARAPIFRNHRGWVFRVNHRAPDAAAHLAKRLFDVTITLLLLPIAAPLVALAAVWVKATSAGPVFFLQRRMGSRGREFHLVKLRTMYMNAEAETGAVWSGRADARVTPSGRILRALGIDELPQLWNVLKGEMSLVGPRPERPEIVRELTEQIGPYMQRLVVPAGITGWAQIHRGCDGNLEDVLDKIRLDLYYARNFSLWFDIAILLRTFQMLLARAKPLPSAEIARPATPPSARCASDAIELVAAGSAQKREAHAA